MFLFEGKTSFVLGLTMLKMSSEKLTLTHGETRCYVGCDNIIGLHSATYCG